MELPATFLHRRWDVPFQFDALSLRGDRIGIRRDGGFAGRADDHTGAVNMKTDVFPALQLVLERDLDAIALVPSKHEWLDPIVLQTAGDRAWIEAFLAPRISVTSFFFPHLIDIFGEHIHITGIKVEPSIQRDLDIDR